MALPFQAGVQELSVADAQVPWPAMTKCSTMETSLKCGTRLSGIFLGRFLRSFQRHKGKSHFPFGEVPRRDKKIPVDGLPISMQGYVHHCTVFGCYQ
jgi:hypothetical protein